MKRDEFRASLEAKSIIMPDWPEIPDEDFVLVVDECGCSAALIEAVQGPRDIQAVSAVDQWAEDTHEAGGFSGYQYPDNEKVYAIFHDGEVIETSLSTEWDPTFTSVIKAD